ncbi:Septal ring factor EnvC, activator of murein hydrolases AmiA and AmiB [Mariniphaga anaerophila]|uniref:Septal ring factor EnvC, activator of murein hydrolases AmiA and AmiB n=1 Tax=Mariniphaga anaerophila TaxID=1484053 RepID=A0A1M5EJM8_9BACT|nr:peptidoglycan DD-metalloendopeptidase family protein [Mariniphaga anaerophila]SHF79449.1 Septal ring factor EnvC, activator of murein hydrolases AmiA and AmiB [Mariniphaga anaerophila]
MRTLVLAGIFIFLQASAMAQSLTDLQQQKEKAAKEIELTASLLGQIQQKEKASLSGLQLINSNINRRNVLISNFNAEIKLYQEFIQNNTLAVDLLSEDLDKMKEEYARLIRMAYLYRNAQNQLLFLLSAENFNQAYRRLLYMRRYTSFRNNQAATMKTMQALLNEKVEKLETLKSTRQQLLAETRNENQKLAQEKAIQNQEIQQLKSQQRDLRRQLAQQRQIEQQLEREIQRMIEEEARKNRAAGEPEYALTPEQKLVGEKFEQNKQRLPWPVERGIVTEKFGIHRHPVLENVQIRNNGINIATEIGAGVRAVFNGEVSRVFGISGGNSAIIIRHGSYLTVYSNLREVTVKKGDKVTTRQKIGTVFTDFEDGNKSVLKFQIWRENQKLNPEDWISR